MSTNIQQSLLLDTTNNMNEVKPTVITKKQHDKLQCAVDASTSFSNGDLAVLKEIIAYGLKVEPRDKFDEMTNNQVERIKEIEAALKKHKYPNCTFKESWYTVNEYIESYKHHTRPYQINPRYVKDSYRHSWYYPKKGINLKEPAHRKYTDLVPANSICKSQRECIFLYDLVKDSNLSKSNITRLCAVLKAVLRTEKELRLSEFNVSARATAGIFLTCNVQGCLALEDTTHTSIKQYIDYAKSYIGDNVSVDYNSHKERGTI